MAEQVAHASFSPFPRGAYRPLYEVAWRISPEGIPGQQELEPSFANQDNGLRPDEHARNIALQITDDHRFHTFFVSIKSILQLDQDSWTAYLHIRNDLVAKGHLEPAQPAIWVVPPDDIWQLLVKLRQTSAFPSLQADILGELGNAYCRAQLPSPLPQSLANRRDRSSYSSTATAFQGALAIPSGVSASIRESNTDAVASSQSRGHNENISDTHPPPLSSAFAQSSDKRSASRVRQAPEGWLYHCPSKGCSKKPYKRLGHYEKHLKKTHPDFGPRHPHHSAQMSLKLGTSSNSSGDRSKDNLHGAAHGPAAIHAGVLGASRRGSRVSTSSFNSTAVSPSAFDDVPEATIYAASGMTVAEASMLQDHSVWHTGGGTLLDNMHVDTLGGFFTGLGRG